MAGAGARLYRAFISYSHKDKAAGDRLFRRLDGYRLPKPLVGRETPQGPVPAKLYPVFRDREELSSSPALAGRLGEALDASDNLVVVCSPHAAASRWVNEEIQMFHDAGRGDRIHAVVVEGEPARAFPPALTEDRSDPPLATDLRAEADGWTDGPLKVIAGILGIGFGELKDREIARARARARRNAAIAVVFALLAIFAGVSAWRAVEQTRVAEAQLSLAKAAILTIVRGVAGLVDRVVAGADRGEISVALADHLLQTAQGMVAGVVDQAPDNRLLKAEEARLNGVLSQHYQRAGQLQQAQEAASRAERLYAELVASGDTSAQRNRSVALNEQGNVLLARGDRAGALAVYEESLEIRRRLSAGDPGNAGWARDVSVSLERIGDVRVAAGDRAGALAVYEESLEIRRRLAAGDPGNAGWARDVYVSLFKVGSFFETDGNRSEAAARYSEALERNARLVALDVGNVQWANDRRVLQARLAAVQVAQ